jgi:hypothetical protein
VIVILPNFVILAHFEQWAMSGVKTNTSTPQALEVHRLHPLALTMVAEVHTAWQL